MVNYSIRTDRSVTKHGESTRYSDVSSSAAYDPHVNAPAATKVNIFAMSQSPNPCEMFSGIPLWD